MVLTMMVIVLMMVMVHQSGAVGLDASTAIGVSPTLVDDAAPGDDDDDNEEEEEEEEEEEATPMAPLTHPAILPRLVDDDERVRTGNGTRVMDMDASISI